MKNVLPPDGLLSGDGRTRLVRQAELTPKLPGVELCWRLAQAHRLPADRLSWAAARFNQAEQPRR